MTLNRRAWCARVAAGAVARVKQTRRFMSDRTRNRWNAPFGRLELSRTCNWYAEDFRLSRRGINSLHRLVSGHAPLLADKESDRVRLRSSQPAIHYLDFDWRLNQIEANS